MISFEDSEVSIVGRVRVGPTNKQFVKPNINKSE